MGKTSCTSSDGLRKGAWTEDENNKLFSYVQQHGGQNWKSLPQKAGLKRCGKSCRLRWVNYLRPGSRRSHFSPDEEETITRLHATLGNKWSAIAKQLYRRTDNEVKNYCNTRLKKRIAKDCVPQASQPSQNSSNVSGTSIDTSTSSAQVLNLIASNVSLIDIERVLSDVEVGSPSNPTPQSCNAISSEALRDTMESQPVIENLLTESTIDYDEPYSTCFEQLPM